MNDQYSSYAGSPNEAGIDALLFRGLNGNQVAQVVAAFTGVPMITPDQLSNLLGATPQVLSQSGRRAIAPNSQSHADVEPIEPQYGDRVYVIDDPEYFMETNNPYRSYVIAGSDLYYELLNEDGYKLLGKELPGKGFEWFLVNVPQPAARDPRDDSQPYGGSRRSGTYQRTIQGSPIDILKDLIDEVAAERARTQSNRAPVAASSQAQPRNSRSDRRGNNEARDDQRSGNDGTKRRRGNVIRRNSQG